MKNIVFYIALIAGVLWSVNIYRKLTTEQTMDTEAWLDTTVYLLVVILILLEIIRRKGRNKQSESD